MKVIKLFTLFAVMMISFITFSCKNDKNNPVNNNNNNGLIQLTSFEPGQVYPQDTVRIYGAGFGYSKDSIIVMLGDVISKIVSLDSKSILVIVPYGIKDSVSIKVIKNKDTIIANKKIKIMVFNQLEFYSYNPNHGRYGSIVQILGQGFIGQKCQPIVEFDNEIAEIISYNDSILNVRVPNVNLGLIDISVSRDTSNVGCSKCFMMTNSDFYFTKGTVSLTNISGTIVSSSYSGTPGQYNTVDTSYPTTTYQVNIIVSGNYDGTLQIYPYRKSFFDNDTICIASGYYQYPIVICHDYHITFLIDTLNKKLHSFMVIYSESGSDDHNNSFDHTQEIDFDNLPYTLSSNGDLIVSAQGQQIKNYFVKHYVNNSDHEKFYGYQTGLKDFSITDNSVLSITIFH